MNNEYIYLSPRKQQIINFVSNSITGKSKTVAQVHSFITGNALTPEDLILHRKSILRDLKQLEAEGILKSEKKGRTYYYSREFTDLTQVNIQKLNYGASQNDEALNDIELARRFPDLAKSGYMDYQPWVRGIIHQAKAAISRSRRLLFALDIDNESRQLRFSDIPVSSGYKQYDAVVIGVLSFSQVPHLLFRQNGKLLATAFNRISHVEISDHSYSYVNHDVNDFKELSSYTDCLKPVQSWVRFEKVVSEKVVDLLMYRQLKGIRNWSHKKHSDGIELAFEYNEFDPEIALLIELIAPLKSSDKITRRKSNRR